MGAPTATDGSTERPSAVEPEPESGLEPEPEERERAAVVLPGQLPAGDGAATPQKISRAGVRARDAGLRISLPPAPAAATTGTPGRHRVGSISAASSANSLVESRRWLEEMQQHSGLTKFGWWWTHSRAHATLYWLLLGESIYWRRLPLPRFALEREHHSWFAFPEDSDIRVLARRYLDWRWRHEWILALVLLNFVLMVCEAQRIGCPAAVGTHGADGTFDGCWRWWLHLLLTLLLTIELTIKSVAVGFLHPHDAYIRRSPLQFAVALVHIIVVCSAWPDGSVTSYCDSTSATMTQQTSSLDLLLRLARVAKMTRALRHARVLSFITKALLVAGPLVLRVGMMFCMVLLIFALVGKEFFSGVLRFHCVHNAAVSNATDAQLSDRHALSDFLGGFISRQSRADEALAPTIGSRCYPGGNECEGEYACHELENPLHDRQSFDDFHSAVLITFQCLTGEGFTDVMYMVWSATSSAWCIPFFITVGVVGTNLIFNMILAVLKDSMSTAVNARLQSMKRENLLVMHNRLVGRKRKPNRASLQGPVHTMATRSTCGEKWEDFSRRTLMPVYVPLRSVARSIIRHKWWARWNVLVLATNTVALCWPWATMPVEVYENLSQFLTILNVLIFIDLGVKLCAYGVRRLFTRAGAWDLMDAIIICSTLAESIAGPWTSQGNQQEHHQMVLRLIPWLRVWRVLELGKFLDSLRAAVSALFASVDVVLQTLLLLGLAIVIFATVGLSLFHCTPTQMDEVEKLSCYDWGYYAAVFNVFQVFSLEGWHTLMYDGAEISPFSAAFYIIWVLLGPFVLLGVIDSAVLDNFERDYFSHRMRVKHHGQAQTNRGSVLEPSKHGHFVAVDDIASLLNSFLHEDESCTEYQVAEFVNRKYKRLAHRHRMSIEMLQDHVIQNHGSHAFLSVSQRHLSSELSEDDLHACASSLLDTDSEVGVTLQKTVIVSLQSLVDTLVEDAETFSIGYRPLLALHRAQDLKTSIELWMILDNDCSGWIEASEISDMFSALGDHERLVDAQNLFATFDIDLDGHVTIQEFLTTLRESETQTDCLVEPQILKLREQFAKLDADQTGQISRQEFRTVMDSWEGRHIPDVEMDIMMDTIDTDDSGQITFLEIMRGLQRIQKEYAPDLQSSSMVISPPALEADVEKRISLSKYNLIDDDDAHVGKAGRHWAFSRVYVRQMARSHKFGSESLLERPVEDAGTTATNKRFPSWSQISGNWCLRIVTHNAFENTVLCLIFCNVVVVAASNPMDTEKHRGLVFADFALSMMFVAEVALRICAHGPRRYLCSSDGPIKTPHAMAVENEALWNVFDLLVVALSALGAVSALISSDGEGFIESAYAVVARTLRALRPMRAISRHHRMRRATGSLIAAWPSIFHIFVLLFFVTIVFAILGLQLFGNAFHRCTEGGVFTMFLTNSPDACENFISGGNAGSCAGTVNCSVSFLTLDACQLAAQSVSDTNPRCVFEPVRTVTSIEVCPFGVCTQAKCEAISDDCSYSGVAHRRWANVLSNFDNFGNSLITLFTVFTVEGWVEISQSMMSFQTRADDPSILLPPNVDYHLNAINGASVFIMIYMLLTAFFLKSLFIGATFSCYIKQCDDDFGVLTTKQRMYVLTERLLTYELEWIRDYSGVEYEPGRITIMRRLARFVIFEQVSRMASTFCVFAQFTLTSASNFDEGPTLRSACAIMSTICTVWLAVEMLAAVVVHGIGKCRSDPWFIIDFVWLVLACGFTAAGLVETPAKTFVKSHPFSMICFRLFRCLRYFRFFHVDHRFRLTFGIVKAINKLQIINEAFVLSLGYIFQIGGLLLLCYVIFAILAMNIFGHLGHPGEHLNSMCHFSDFPTAMLSIVRISYGEDWQLIYEDIVFHSCDNEGDLRLHNISACRAAWATSLFFVSLFFFGVFCVQNLFIALIVDDFAIVVAREYNGMAMEQVSHWLDSWPLFATARARNHDSEGPDGVMESFMDMDHFVEFLKHVPEPLGVGLEATDATALKRMEEIGVRVADGGRLFFLDTLQRAVNRVAVMVNPCTRMDVPHLHQQYLGQAYVTVLATPVSKHSGAQTKQSPTSESTDKQTQSSDTVEVPPMRLYHRDANSTVDQGGDMVPNEGESKP